MFDASCERPWHFLQRWLFSKLGTSAYLLISRLADIVSLMRRPPTQGIKGAKPRIPKPQKTKRRLRKVHDADDREIENLNRAYLLARNEQMQAKARVAQREARLSDGELIEVSKCRAVVEHYLILMRQRLWWLPNRVRARFRNHPDFADYIDQEIRGALEELSELPRAVASGRVIDYQSDPELKDRGNGNGDGDDELTRRSRR
jgi:hypothetical protein